MPYRRSYKESQAVAQQEEEKHTFCGTVTEDTSFTACLNQSGLPETKLAMCASQASRLFGPSVVWGGFVYTFDFSGSGVLLGLASVL